MTDHVFRLEEASGQTAIAGGKAANLGALAAAGFPVPPGFVVSAEACREFFEAAGIDRALDGLGDGSRDALAQRCAELQHRIVSGEVPASLAAAILDAHARLAAGRSALTCAVRSSATAEDLPGASFAGQHHTYYYVEAPQLLEMIRHCWASLFSPEAVSYRSTHGIAHASVFMAVMVQEMVPSEVSGVAFTANPVSGDRGEIVIESSWGMGAAIVDGRVTPDRYVVGRDGLRVREQRIADKRFMVPSRLEQTRSERLVEVPLAMRRRETLHEDQVKAVASWSLRCEESFGDPQDVEWAIAGGRFYLLQSRPITTLRTPDPDGAVEGQYVLFKPLAENFTEPLAPLSAELVLSAMPKAFGRLIFGRIYMDLAPVRVVLPFRISDEDLASILFLSGEPTASRAPLSLRKLPVTLAAALLFYLAFGVAFSRTRGMPDDFMDDYRALCRRVEADPRLGPPEALRRLFLPRFFDSIGRMAIIVNLSAFRFAPWMTALRAMLRRWAPEVRPDAVALLCSGAEGVLSAEMGREIRRLAHEARPDAAVAETLVRHEPEEALARLRQEPAARDFLARLDAFLAVHGHRGIREFELRSARWDENAAPVIGMIRNHLMSVAGATDPEEKAARVREDLEAQIQRSVRGVRWRLVQVARERAREYLKLRENSRFYHIMAIGVVRKKILAIEAELVKCGRLKCKDDIFFLRWREVVALQQGRLEWRDVDARIRERRMEHVRLTRISPPRTVGIERRAEPHGLEAAGGAELRGQAASPGRCQGIARVILDPSADLVLRPGEILVAPYTDPAWTPLFLTAGAAVVEVGSYLSHAGTVAREFGMPCVVDVADCTRRIRTGDRVDVDGDSGLVRVLDAGAA
ncbi:MAG TPA: PEP/pyruvate-binding domain-containing protein [Vicinamibacteria bacterium]